MDKEPKQQPAKGPSQTIVRAFRYRAMTPDMLSLRIEKANANARLVADYLRDHPKVAKSINLGHHAEDSPAARLYARQCSGEGSIFSFDIVGGRAASTKFLNALQIFKLAVSLGGEMDNYMS